MLEDLSSHEMSQCHEPTLNDPSDSSDVPTVIMLTLLIYEFKKNKGRVTSSDKTGIQKLPVLHSPYLSYDRTLNIW
jgi:hypothetical protein